MLQKDLLKWALSKGWTSKQKNNNKKSVGHHSIMYLKSARAFEQNFAFATLSFWKQWISILLPHSSFVKMQLSTYEVFGLKF